MAIVLNPELKLRGLSATLKKEASDTLWRRGEILNFVLDPNQLGMAREVEQSDSLIHVILCSRRLGKCLAKGTKITTANRGILPIEQIQVGDMVYGYNSDGTLSPTKVEQVHYQGLKKVYDYMHHDRVLVTATKEHRWLTEKRVSGKIEVASPESFTNDQKIVRMQAEQVGGVEVPNAYALGALLGDGCSKQNTANGTRQIFISSANELVPNKISRMVGLNLRKNQGGNYTWALYGDGEDVKSTVPYYLEWCFDRYAHEKIIDLDIVKTWSRHSKLELIAGLLDTDGCLQVSKGNLVLSFSMQAKSVIDALEYLFKEIWGIEFTRLVDNRTKYVNGPCHTLMIKHNAFIRRVYADLDSRLVTSSRKWKEEYNFFTYQKSADYAGVTLVNEREEECWDIGIDNDTHLYMLANGMITHNSYMLSAICIEKALRKPNQLIKFITSTQRSARDIVLPLFREILSTCPDDLRPEWRVHENRYKFSNGSEILLHGVDSTGGDDLRGQAADFWVIDEAGFISKLEVLVREILNPMIIQRGGRGLLSSTPPRSSSHDFVRFLAKAEKDKALTKRTIYDCKRFTPKMIEAFEAEAGGRDSEIFRREYLCELIFLNEDSVIPEFTEELKSEIVYRGKQVLNFVPDRYVALDPGFADNTAILFGYYNYPEATLYIEREYCESGNNTEEIASAIHTAERELWGSLPPTKRVSDIDLRLIKDLKDMHGLKFVPTQKDNKEAQINQLRIFLKQKRIRIHESCVNLLTQLRYSQWKVSASGRRDYARSAELGHSDLIDALLYLIRNVNFNRNPIADPAIDPHSYWYVPENKHKSANARKLAKAFR